MIFGNLFINFFVEMNMLWFLMFNFLVVFFVILILLKLCCLKLIENVKRFGFIFFVIEVMIDELILLDKNEFIGILLCICIFIELYNIL